MSEAEWLAVKKCSETLPFCIYADFESILEKIHKCDSKNDMSFIKYQHH